MGALSDINSGKFLVLGRAGTATTGAPGLGKHLTWVIRSVKRPVLVVTKAYTEPSRVLFAFDGSAVTRKGVEMLAASPLLKGLPIHLLMSGADAPQNQRSLAWAPTATRHCASCSWAARPQSCSKPPGWPRCCCVED